MKKRWGFQVLGFIVTVCFLAPLIAPYSFETQNLDSILTPVSLKHWMGTDNLGRDIFSRVLYGGRISLFVAIVTSLFALVFGTIVGTLAGISRGFAEVLWLKVFDVFQSIPTMVLMILLTVIFDSVKWIEDDQWRSLAGILAALSLVGWVSVARVVRAQVRLLQRLDFVVASRSLGSGPFRIFWNHILPNLVGSLLVLFAFQVPSHILQESFLSFLGLGLQPPYSSWGVLIHEGWRSFQVYPHLILGPGMILFMTIYSFNSVSDWLRDKINPKLTSNG